MNRGQIEAEAIAAISEKAKSFGYQFFTAKSGGYGICALPDGSRCIYFGFSAPSYAVNVSMQLKPSTATGSGFRIAEVDLEKLNNADFESWFSAIPPTWAGGNSNWGYQTLSAYKKLYIDLYFWE